MKYFIYFCLLCYHVHFIENKNKNYIYFLPDSLEPSLFFIMNASIIITAKVNQTYFYTRKCTCALYVESECLSLVLCLGHCVLCLN